MKVVVPVPKPRAKQLNAVLVSKRCERHVDLRHVSRAKQEQQVRVLIKDQL